jgi:RNA polymerase sigma factor (sigma-70 family)
MLAVHAVWGALDHPEAFLRTVVVNRARSTQRRQIVERLHLQRFREREAISSAPVLDETWNVIRSLPVKLRIVVVLRYYEDLSLSEIAVLLGQPLGTVKSNLHRAIRKLEELLPHD